MFSKKVIFPMAAFAMASLVACGDDSSSSAGSDTSKTDVVPASVKSVFELDNVTCSQTVNFCKTVVVEGLSELAQCDGAMWNMQMLRKPVTGCENAAPAAEDPAAEEPAAGEPAAETPAAEEPAGEEPAGPGAGEEPAGPGAGEEPAGPGAGEEPAAGGDVIYCVIPGVMGGCEALPAAMAGECETTLEGQLVDACPAE